MAWHRPDTNGGAGRHASDRVRWEAVELLDRDAVRAAVARLRPSVVYHCAGAAHVGRAWEQAESTFATNVRGTHHLLDALARTGVESRVLIPSSALVYASADRALREDDPVVPTSPYGLSKLAQEMLARHAGRGVTVWWPAHSITSDRGRTRFSLRPASRGASQTSSGASGRRKSRSATWTRGATSRT